MTVTAPEIRKTYASGQWCAPSLSDALFVRSFELFVFASVLAGELRILGAVGSFGTWGAHQVRSAMEVMILFGTPLVLSAFALYELAL